MDFFRVSEIVHHKTLKSQRERERERERDRGREREWSKREREFCTIPSGPLGGIGRLI